MNQLLIILLATSIIAAIALYKKIGLWRAITIAIALPILLFTLAILLLVIGGDK